MGGGGEEGGGRRGENIQFYSKRKQKLVMCVVKQTLLFLVSVKLCVLESCICLREVSDFPFGYVPLEFDGRCFGAMLRLRGAGGRGEGRKAPRWPCQETGHHWLRKLIIYWAK